MNEWLKKKCSKLQKSIKNNPYTYSFWIGAIAILIPLFTWVVYLIGDYGFVLIHTSLSVGDALGFYGSFLAFLGTVALGALALWQNDKIRNQAKDENNELKRLNNEANKINSRLLDIQEAQVMPLIDISNLKPSFIQNQNGYSLTLCFENTGNSHIKYFSVKKMDASEIDDLKRRYLNIGYNISKVLSNIIQKILRVTNDCFMGKISENEFIGLKIKENQSCTIELNNEDKFIALKINITNIYGNQYVEIIAFDIQNSDNINNKQITNVTWDIKKEN